MGKREYANAVNLAIDPGSEHSGWVEFIVNPDLPSGVSVTAFGKTENRELRKQIREHKLAAKPNRGLLAVEMPKAQGMPEKNEIFQTCVEIGRFLQTWGGTNWCYVFRQEVKLELCGQARAKDPNVRQALLDLWGGEDVAIGGKRRKRCKGQGWTGREHKPCPQCQGSKWECPPGPLHGMSADVWAALAVAVAWTRKQGKTRQLKPSRAKQMLACDRCNIKNCRLRGDAYNVGCEPGVDCLAAK